MAKLTDWLYLSFTERMIGKFIDPHLEEEDEFPDEFFRVMENVNNYIILREVSLIRIALSYYFMIFLEENKNEK